MTKEEIFGGLRNALDRGESMDQAVKSFINAGYSPIEVKTAASELSQGISTFVDPATTPSTSQDHIPSQDGPEKKKSFFSKFKLNKAKKSLEPKSSTQQSQDQSPNQKKKLKKWMIVSLIVLAVLAAVVILISIFSQQILESIA